MDFDQYEPFSLQNIHNRGPTLSVWWKVDPCAWSGQVRTTNSDIFGSIVNSRCRTSLQLKKIIRNLCSVFWPQQRLLLKNIHQINPSDPLAKINKSHQTLLFQPQSIRLLQNHNSPHLRSDHHQKQVVSGWFAEYET